MISIYTVFLFMYNYFMNHIINLLSHVKNWVKMLRATPYVAIFIKTKLILVHL